MISIRQLLVLVVVIAGVWLFRRLQQQFAARFRGDARRPEIGYRDMVRCEACGVYLPREEARGDADHGYRCNEAACLARRA